MLKLSILYTWRVSLSIKNNMSGIFWTLRLYPSEYSYHLPDKCSEEELFAWLSFFLMKQAWSVKVCRSTCYQWEPLGRKNNWGPTTKDQVSLQKVFSQWVKIAFLACLDFPISSLFSRHIEWRKQNWFLFNIHYNIKVILVQCPLSL